MLCSERDKLIAKRWDAFLRLEQIVIRSKTEGRRVELKLGWREWQEADRAVYVHRRNCPLCGMEAPNADNSRLNRRVSRMMRTRKAAHPTRQPDAMNLSAGRAIPQPNGV